jgi:hypothetical protein
MGDEDWVVVSFHTATAETLLEERPSDDARPDDGPASAERYAGRSGRD